MILQPSVLPHPFIKIWSVKFLPVAGTVPISKELQLSESLLLLKRYNSTKELNERIHVSQMYARAHTCSNHFRGFEVILSVIKHTIFYVHLNICYERLKESDSNIL